MRRSMRRRIVRVGLAGLAGTMLGTSPAGADDTSGEVTAVIGEVVTGSGRVLGNRSQVADDERIALGKDGAASILFDKDSLVELCEETKIAFDKDPQTGARRIRVDAGAIRIVVEPRDALERIEIHTPAAIATILGTIVHVSVDPATGETTITGEENQVRVKSSDPSVAGATTVSAMEQVVMRPGGTPPQSPRQLAPEEVEQLAGCQVDFHGTASNVASYERRLHSAERIATSEPSLEIWSAQRALPAALADPAGPLTNPDDVCSAVDCPGVEMNDEPREIDTQGTFITDGY